MKKYNFAFYLVLTVTLILLIPSANAAQNEKLKNDCNHCDPLAECDESWDRAAIEAVNAQFMQAWEAGRADKVAALYTEDALFFAPGFEKPFRGPKEIEGYLQVAIDNGINRNVLQTRELEVYCFRHKAYELGSYRLYAEDEKSKPVLVDTGPYLVIWKKVKGQWMLHRDILNSSVPQ